MAATLPLPQLGMEFTYKFALPLNAQHLWRRLTGSMNEIDDRQIMSEQLGVDNLP